MSLLKQWQVTNGLKFSIHLTKCIVKYPPSEVHEKKHTKSLLVPTNPILTSTTLFPYFQRGGKPITKIPLRPASASSSQWGGMDAGTGMVYPVQTVDGQVYSLGGPEYWSALANMRQQLQQSYKEARLSEDDKSDLPESLSCSAFGHLKTVGYDHIIHVASPVFKDGARSETWLRRCYERGFVGSGLYQKKNCEFGSQTLVVPLVGAGCRGWPLSQAANGVVESILDLASQLGDDNTQDRTVNLVLVDQEVADIVLEVAAKQFDS